MPVYFASCLRKAFCFKEAIILIIKKKQLFSLEKRGGTICLSISQIYAKKCFVHYRVLAENNIEEVQEGTFPASLITL